MKCKKCGNNLFYVEVTNSCGECIENGIWTEEGYVYDKGNHERSEVEEEGECAMGSAWGEGCHLYTCQECKHKTNLAIAY